jgi:hypothetical protein
MKPPWKDQNDREAMLNRARRLSAQLFQSPAEVTIDAFLDTPRGHEFEEEGKRAIAAALLPAEVLALRRMMRLSIDPSLRRSDVLPLSDGWYGWLNTRLKPFLGEREPPAVEFVTFNYDRSLEFSILFAVRAMFSAELAWTEIFPRLVRVHHVYGELGLPVGATFELARSHERPNVTGEALVTAASTLRLMSEARSSHDHQPVQQAREALKRARRVAFCGFGFDALNLRILGISPDFAATAGKREVRGTCLNKTDAETAEVADALGITQRISSIDQLPQHLPQVECHQFVRSFESRWFVPSKPADPDHPTEARK